LRTSLEWERPSRFRTTARHLKRRLNHASLGRAVEEHIRKGIASLESHAKQAEELLPHVAEKYAGRWKAAIDARWKQALELSALLQEIKKRPSAQLATSS
jgi:hypothetical protein